jgi:hypothetical protein
VPNLLEYLPFFLQANLDHPDLLGHLDFLVDKLTYLILILLYFLGSDGAPGPAGESQQNTLY